MLNCKFCSKECKNNNSLRNHERLCKSNPDRDISYFSTLQFRQSAASKPKVRNGYMKAADLGLPKPIMSAKTREKLSKAVLSRTPEFNKAMGKKISATVNDKVANGEWHTSLAKDMHYNYNGEDLHGSWELKYAKWLDANNIKWVRNKQSFSYDFGGKSRRYTPDFYLPETSEFIEIKGYKTDKDIAKWEQFPSTEKLSILYGKDLKSLGIEV